MKAIRNAAAGAALGAFGAWAEVIDLAWQLMAHPVSDEDGAIAAGKHGTSCAYFTCRGSIGGTLGRQVMRRRGCCCTRAVRRKVGNGRGGLCARQLGRRHLTTGQVRHRTMPRLERHNRELRRRENLGTVWTEHNLPALLPEQGLSNQSI